MELNSSASSAPLQGAGHLLATILDSTPDLIAAVDTNLCFTAMNAAYARDFQAIFGVEAKVGADLAALLASLPNDQQAALALFRRALQGETCIVTETFGDPLLSRRCYELRFSPVRHADGRIIGAAHVGRDVTERARREANQAFLADLGQEFPYLSSPVEIMQTVGARVGAYLKVRTCNFVDVDERQGTLTVRYGWREAESSDLERTFPIEAYLTEEFRRASRAGETIAIRNTQDDSRTDAKSYAALNIHAFLAVPFHVGSEWKYQLSVTDSRSREWRPDEIELFQELANRIFPRIEQARAAQALRESEEKYRALFNNMTEGFALGEPILNEQGGPVDICYLEANEAFYRHTGFPRDILGRPHRDFLPEVEQSWIDRFAAVALTGQPDEMESYSASTRRHYDVRSFCPSPGRFAIVFRDITEQKRIQEALLDTEARYKALFNNKTMAIAHQRIITDDEGRPVDFRIEAVNKPYEEIVGFKRDEAVGKLVTELFPQIRDAEFDFIGEFGRVAFGGGEKDFEVYFPPLGRWLSIYAYSPGRGECTGMFTDITAQKEAEAAILRINADLEQRVADRTRELTRANEALLSSNDELKRFAYIASHDLQTPLRTITGFSQILQKDYKGRLDEGADEYLDRIVEGARRLHVLIRDLLTYSRVDSQAQPFEPVEFQEVFQSVITALRGSIEEAGAEVTHGDLPRVMGDRSQLTQLLQNLIENGLKYRGPEPLRIHVWAERQPDEWRFSVRDNGIGINAKHHESIFEVFRRLHTQQAYPGTGIGLSVCRRVVERHGGRIWVDSEPGHGSVFHFTLPIPKGNSGH